MPSDPDALTCDGCSAEVSPRGLVLLQVAHREQPSTVSAVYLVCGPRCRADVACVTHCEVLLLSQIEDDVLETLDRMVAAWDWGRGTMHRFSRILSSIHSVREAATTVEEDGGADDAPAAESGERLTQSERDLEDVLSS